jgi:hypothetical protein
MPKYDVVGAGDSQPLRILMILSSIFFGPDVLIDPFSSRSTKDELKGHDMPTGTHRGFVTIVGSRD